MTGGVSGLSPEQREKWLSGVKSATNFSPTITVAGGYAETYSLPGGGQCFSFDRNGPPYGPSYGYAFSLYGYHCDRSKGTPSSLAINAYMQSISVKP